MTISPNHICFTSSPLISEISKPLFESSSLNFFSYGRVFNTNQCIVFHTNNALIESWFQREAPSPSCLNEGIHLWDELLSGELVQVRKDLNLGNGICVVNHHENYTDIFSFNTSADTNNSMSLYLNQMNALNKFCLYFKDQASKLIQQAIENPLILSDLMLAPSHINTPKETANLSELMDSLKIKNYYFNDKYNGIKLTKREVECLSLYLKGKTSHDIATSLSLNKKTIDTFLSLIKKKFDCRTRSELFEIIWELGILKSNGWIKV